MLGRVATRLAAGDVVQVEVAWEMTYEKRGGGEYTCTCWCPGVVKKASTVNTFEGRKKLGLGWLFIEYEMDGSSSWLLANRPKLFNANKAGAWRFKGEKDDDEGDESDSDEMCDDDLVDADGEGSSSDEDGMSDD